MKKENLKNFLAAIFTLFAFLLWTAAVLFIDVEPIGPWDSAVGLAAVNQFFHNLTGVNMTLYVVTDWLGLVPIMFATGFGVVGLVQWIKRKHIGRVDYSILILGGFYIVTVAAYILFEEVVINYRPILINGYLEASYPSSTTLLVTCVMPTAVMQFNSRIKTNALRRFVACSIIAFIAFMVIGRLVSGVHWLSDIVGGGLLSAGRVFTYRFFVNLKEK